jgi:DNA-binding beta-propeller fold protein YncE
LPIYGKTDVRPQITGLATTNDGAILLVDRANKQIQRFRQDGTFQRFVGGNHTFQLPFGVTVTKNDDIVVSDSCQMTILDGGNEDVKSTYGTRGIGKGKFLNPRGLTVDIDNNIIVADCESHQIHVLNVENENDSLFGSLGTDAGFFDTPCDVAVSSDGRKIVVVEARNHRLQIFTRPHQDCNYEKYI